MKSKTISFDEAISIMQKDLIDFDHDCDLRKPKTIHNWYSVFQTYRKAERKRKALEPVLINWENEDD